MGKITYLNVFNCFEHDCDFAWRGGGFGFSNMLGCGSYSLSTSIVQSCSSLSKYRTLRKQRCIDDFCVVHIRLDRCIIESSIGRVGFNRPKWSHRIGYRRYVLYVWFAVDRGFSCSAFGSNISAFQSTLGNILASSTNNSFCSYRPTPLILRGIWLLSREKGNGGIPIRERIVLTGVAMSLMTAKIWSVSLSLMDVVVSMLGVGSLAANYSVITTRIVSTALFLLILAPILDRNHSFLKIKKSTLALLLLEA